MKKNFINSTHIEGLIYEHKLEKKVTGEKSKNPGTEYISGSLSVVTDDEGLNVVEVHFRYVTEVTSRGKPNATYGILLNIIEGKIGSVMEHGAENAGKVKIDSAINLNEWFDDRTPGSPLVSIKRNEGGFIHTVQTLAEKPEARATFNVDIVITGVIRKDEDPERGLPERGIVRGYIFDFRQSLLPVELPITTKFPKALDYFESLEASPKNPVFTRVQGEQVSKVLVKVTTEESAFGEPVVKQTKSTIRDFEITWASPTPYEWDSEDTLLASELAKMMSDRELHLAEVKKSQDEYKATKGNALSGAATPATTVKSGDYQF